MVDGPARVIEVAKWFTDQSNSSSGLKVLRVKNLFALQRDEVPDGYRDLKLFVALSSSSGLGIIGEIQVIVLLHTKRLKICHCLCG